MSTESKKTLYKSYQVIWYVVYFIEVLLLLRFTFRLLGANPASAFVDFIYSLSAVFVAPFSNIFPSPADSAFVLDSPTLVAAIVYPLLAYLLTELLGLIKPVSNREAESVDIPDEI